MDTLEQAYYEAKFENEFRKAKGNAFQTLFNELMGRAYKKDYMPCRPWGDQGDQKNDGFLRSGRILFQVYAPNEMKEKNAIKKIDEDFDGAKIHWGKHFDKWAFVHNAYDGLPPHVQRKILDIANANPWVQLETWGLEELRDIFRQLPREELQSWFGFAPNNETKKDMTFKEISVVLESIKLKKPDPTIPVKEVPPGKIEANQLSECIAVLLKHGMEKASLVDQFFSHWYDPTFGESIAAAFRKQYEIIRENKTPNEIFHEFQSWVGGAERGTAEHEMAVLTIIAYYFESCDIFEEPPKVIK